MFRFRWGLVAALVATLWAAFHTPSPAAAGGELDVAAWLRKPNVRLVVVEFYADWCAPCKASVPKWKALHDRYRADGLRLIVVSVGESGVCTNPGWDPDQIVCDEDGHISERFGDAAAKLPQAFLYSWQGNRLAAGASVEQVEATVERYFRETPRIVVEEGRDAEGKPLKDGAALRAMAQAELSRNGKFIVVANEAERAKLAAERRRVLEDPRYSDKGACQLGEEVSPNSILTTKRIRSAKNDTVVVELYSIEKGCMTATERVRVSGGNVEAAVTEAVGGLVSKLVGSHVDEMPERIASSASSRPAGPKAARDFSEQASDWQPDAGDGVLVSFDSTPKGAVVLVDGKLLCAATPCTKEVAKGSHSVSMQAEKYLERRERLNVKAKTSVAWPLAANFATVSVTTTPPGLDVEIDGKVAGKSPLTGLELTAGPHTVKTVSPCHLGAGREFVAARGEQIPLTFTPAARESAIKVTVVNGQDNAVEAEVFVDGQKVGTSPGTFKVPLCSKVVEARSANGTARQDLKLVERQVASVALKLGASAGDMVTVPAGNLFMGCNEAVDQQCDDDEKPGRVVYVSEFRIDRTEVTVAAYARCVDAGSCSEDGLTMPYWAGIDDKEHPEWKEYCNWGKRGREEHPLNCVSWPMAVNYCRWAGKRLPTEAEWEKAARGSDGREYPWGNRGYASQTAPVANIADESVKRGEPRASGWTIAEGYDDGFVGTAPVGRFAAGKSPYGALDMVGNVWEWVSDWYGKSLPAAGYRDPEGPSGGEYRVLRGGSWDGNPAFARASYRGRGAPAERFGHYGFRCAQ